MRPQTETVGGQENPVVNSRQRGMKPQKKDTARRQKERIASRQSSSARTFGSVQSAVGSARQESESTATACKRRSSTFPNLRLSGVSHAALWGPDSCLLACLFVFQSEKHTWSIMVSIKVYTFVSSVVIFLCVCVCFLFLFCFVWFFFCVSTLPF